MVSSVVVQQQEEQQRSDTMELSERRIAALHPALNATYSESDGWANLNGWQQLRPTIVMHETQIDLSGYAMESLTFFANGIGLQDPGIYAFAPGESEGLQGLIVLDIVTSVPMDLETLMLTQMNDLTGPGMLGSLYEFETILFGMYRFFTPNTNITYPAYQSLVRSQRFDSGEPTAADKLYCYRVVGTITLDLDDASTLQIPAARQIIAGAMGDEPDLVYMQRLKRSYELANQV